ncbi:hypothetical protein CsSME_00037884 [Camellia sinensis var. sinensis]
MGNLIGMVLGFRSLDSQHQYAWSANNIHVLWLGGPISTLQSGHHNYFRVF